MSKDQITVLIYSHNSEKIIGGCIDSVRPLTSNIILIDLDSTDKTVRIAKDREAHIVNHPFVKIVEEVREFGIEKAKTDWVLIIDDDEKLTDKLIGEILTIKDGENLFTHYKIPRKEIFSHKVWLRHGGWWPNHQLRLFRKDALIEWPKVIHSTPRFKGELGYLTEPFLHYSQNDWSEIVNKTIRFEGTESQLLYDANRPVSTIIFFRKFLGELYRRLIKNGGFRDGQVGIIESIYQAYSKTITYIFLYEKKKSRTL